jgi:hypothetical protein
VDDRSQQNWRQLAVRARRHLEAHAALLGRPATPAGAGRAVPGYQLGRGPGRADRPTGQDLVIYSDGGGKVAAARRPIFGGERVAAFLARVAHRGWRAGDQTRFVDVNGQPGFLIGQDAGRRARARRRRRGGAAVASSGTRTGYATSCGGSGPDGLSQASTSQDEPPTNPGRFPAGHRLAAPRTVGRRCRSTGAGGTTAAAVHPLAASCPEPVIRRSLGVSAPHL